MVIHESARRAIEMCVDAVTRPSCRSSARYCREPGKSDKSYPLLYQVYIDNLIITLCMRGNRLCIYDIYLNCPTAADDIVLIAYSRVGLDNKLYICKFYAEKWEFVDNANQCAISECKKNAKHSSTKFTNHIFLVMRD